MTASSSSPTLLAKTVSTTAGVTHIDLNFSATMAKGRGSIFVTDGAVQTVIDRATGEPKLRVVGATFTKEIPLSQVTVNGSHVSFDAAGLAGGKHYSIFMGAGTLTSGGSPFAGYTVPNQVAFDTPGDTTPLPALGATLSIADAALKSGAPLEVTVTFTHAVSTVDPTAFAAQHARVVAAGHSEDGITWHFKLMQDDSVDSPSNLLRLDMSQVVPASGSPGGSGIVTSQPYAVDTLVDSHVGELVLASDTGIDRGDLLTCDDRQIFSGTLVGDMDPGEHLKIVITHMVEGLPQQRTVNGAAIEFETVDGVTTWTYDSEREREGDYPAYSFAQGANTIVARVVDGDGHASQDVALTVNIDTEMPWVDTSPNNDDSVETGADIRITFSEAMHWSLDEEGDGHLLVLSSEAGDRTITIDQSDFSGDGKTLILRASELGLEADTDYNIYLPSTLRDAAGNMLGEYAIDFHTANDALPSAQSVIVHGDGSYRVGQTISFRIRFNENIDTVDGAIPSIVLSNGKRIEIDYIDRTDAIFSYAVVGGDNSDDLRITDTSELAGTIQDLSGNVLDAAHIVFTSPYVDGYGNAITVQVDTLAPDAPLVANGSVGITNDDSPTLSGSGEANGYIVIYEGTTQLGYGAVNENGEWDIDLGTWEPLGDGTHHLSVHQIDRAGNQSAASSYTLAVDTSAPQALEAPVLTNDTGSSSSDRVTNDTTLSGSSAEANAHIKIMSGENIVGSGIADADGNWTAVFGSSLPDGSHTYTVRQVDAAGNTSADSPTISFTVDRSAPAAPSGTPDLAAASDSGVSDNDNLTSDDTPTFHGSGALPDSVVVLYANEVEKGRAVSDASGNWSITSSSLADDQYRIAVRQLDTAGNQSSNSGAIEVRIDTTGPSLMAALADQPRKEYLLRFDETVFFMPEGFFRLKEGEVNAGRFEGGDNYNWTLGSGAGGEDSVLALKVDASGRFKLEMNSDAITDLAGNVAVIGTPEWTFDL